MANQKEELSSTLRLSREKAERGMTLVFQDGSRHVIHPTKAFRADWRGLAESIAGNRAFRIERHKTEETPEPKQ